MARYNKISASLKHGVKSSCNATEKSKAQYISIIEAFGQWVEAQEGTQRVDPALYHDLIQKYINERSKTKSPETVNKDLASLCAGSGESKTDYIHPKRNTAPTRGRNADGTVKEGKPTADGQRLYELARYIGVREKEYLQFRGGDIRTDANGYTFVTVRKGKGGKRQEQLVDPQHAQEVRAAFAAAGRDGFVFDKKEIEGCEHANLHGLRRKHAQTMYKWFLSQSRPIKNKVMEIVKARFLENQKKGCKVWGRVTEKIQNSPIIKVRGHNKSTMKKRNETPVFDREAVIAVSVLCLAHYREDVTVSNYLV